MEIKIGAYKLKNLEYEDTDEIVKYANNRKVWINVDDSFPHPYNRSDAREWISNNLGKPVLNFSIASENEAIGGIGLKLMKNIYRCTAEVGYWLGEPFWGRGIATAALDALVDYAFSNFDLVRLQAIVFEWNPASMRVLEKNGFNREAKLAKGIIKDGKIIDAFLYARTK